MSQTVRIKSYFYSDLTLSTYAGKCFVGVHFALSYITVNIVLRDVIVVRNQDTFSKYVVFKLFF